MGNSSESASDSEGVGENDGRLLPSTEVVMVIRNQKTQQDELIRVLLETAAWERKKQYGGLVYISNKATRTSTEQRQEHLQLHTLHGSEHTNFWS